MTNTRASTHGTAPLPHPRFRLPILGDLASVDFAQPIQGLAREARRHHGIFEQRIGDFPVVVVDGPELIEEINNEELWEKNVGPTLHKLRSVAGDGLFTAYNTEDNWRKAHDILMPAFTKQAMTNYHASIVDTVHELVTVWNSHAKNKSWVDVPFDLNRLTIEIISRSGFGYSFSSLADPRENPFLSAVLRELQYANRRTDSIPLYEQFLGGARRRGHVADKRAIRAQIDKIIDARRAESRTGQSPDILDIMLTSSDPLTGEKLDNNNIGNQILTFLVAGSETSANAIAFALHFLSTHPDIAAKARAEVDASWPARAFPAFAFDQIAKLRYLRLVVDETLRLWPVAPGYFRQAKQDTTIGEGRYSFKEKDWVFVNLLAAQRHPSWGPDADQFNPDRFLTENRRKLPTHVHRPFGVGARACIGRQFAQHEILIALAAILHQYELTPRPGYKLKVSETLTLKPSALELGLTKRT
ncbi:cytochrome P450 [Mycobacteroides abscessus]|uniref:Cytochrome P450 n=1 Tax=Mycobacteroides abscessus TaxID=36809 RepID=A0A0U0ZP74_9MYCO|nr:cytochrome P450 [Mycobacteroides abscessus]SKU66363.1 cytochrome P450 [Mycobacteroides abscessus subsp. abscessus]MBL3734192.1 cytochrome P450 [Mycobacteroides abscessus subsp. massiliense]MBL3746486.1 cytochrome P450 [Mycobacteroides abscessus subsp. massiliense]MBL3762349.1 cytochrome P450 [Mycobacteroides abscessus subsp. massiliense]MBN7481779.1 cytochrome P450 [Mycobacteroides abscessus subsp. massiliense]